MARSQDDVVHVLCVTSGLPRDWGFTRHVRRSVQAKAPGRWRVWPTPVPWLRRAVARVAGSLLRRTPVGAALSQPDEAGFAPSRGLQRVLERRLRLAQLRGEPVAVVAYGAAVAPALEALASITPSALVSLDTLVTIAGRAPSPMPVPRVAGVAGPHWHHISARAAAVTDTLTPAALVRIQGAGWSFHHHTVSAPPTHTRRARYFAGCPPLARVLVSMRNRDTRWR